MLDFLFQIRDTFAWDVGVLVHLATLGFILGFLFRSQLVLRLLVLIATVLYIIYYYSFPAEPLWGAIIGSLLILVANITGTLRLLYSRIPLRINGEQKRIFESLKGLEPGEFRRLMKIGEFVTAKSDTTLTELGVKPEYLYYVINGQPTAFKDKIEFAISPGKFIGEVSFVLKSAASATVKLPEGGRFIRWPRDLLQRTLEKNPQLQRAFEAQIGRDMARKVAISEVKDDLAERFYEITDGHLT